MSQTFTQLQAVNQWQIDEINAAIKEVDAGDFASEEELQAVIEKWKFLEGNYNAENKKNYD